MKARLLTAGLALAVAAGAVTLLALRSSHGSAPTVTSASPPPAARGCTADPQSCGFPGAATTGVPARTALRTVPGQVPGGPGWTFDAATGAVEVTGNNAVLSGLYIPHNLDIKGASHVTITDDHVVTGGDFGISLRHTADVTVENTTVSGQNATTGRVNYAIDDIYGDSTGMVIKNDNISDWRIGLNVTSGDVTGNYIHHPGYLAGDHTDGIFDNGGSAQLTISGNTILNNLGQTDAIMLYVPAGQTVANKTITGNLLAGGSYPLYAGGNSPHHHQGQPVQPAVLSRQRPVRPRRPLQPARTRKHLVRQRLDRPHTTPRPPARHHHPPRPRQPSPPTASPPSALQPPARPGITGSDQPHHQLRSVAAPGLTTAACRRLTAVGSASPRSVQGTRRGLAQLLQPAQSRTAGPASEGRDGKAEGARGEPARRERREDRSLRRAVIEFQAEAQGK